MNCIVYVWTHYRLCDSEGNIYPPVFGDDDYISDLVWENFKTDVDITSYKIIELLKFVVDSHIAELRSILNDIPIIQVKRKRQVISMIDIGAINILWPWRRWFSI